MPSYKGETSPTIKNPPLKKKNKTRFIPLHIFLHLSIMGYIYMAYNIYYMAHNI